MIMIMFMIMDHNHDLDHVNDKIEYKSTESHNLHSSHGNVMDNYTGVNYDPTPIHIRTYTYDTCSRAHTIFRPTKG